MTSYIANYLYLDGTIVQEEVIGVGGAGIVVNREGYALNIPRISKVFEIDGVPVDDRILNADAGDSYDELAVAIKSFRHDKAIYKRLGDHPGIIPCYNVDSEDPNALDGWRPSQVFGRCPADKGAPALLVTSISVCYGLCTF
ncbi:hypothetical protein Z517_01299 [Fonsecaea pedrosoi CBS 271.37]|uniref:Uncharacterized protein n=1 Tax=Fonsecaea pedrosoi CBS 271.37 TaxID=1442368 RepID=A0A0D2E742_9EURO|nr:uncharacterized protein Z517_01299 [Fonsecaea pedrosoi CBS 271.37]KIW85906.1 hypothetical protein Z517_01299 [Fonsecaea pedrosoi CBS 271.37]